MNAFDGVVIDTGTAQTVAHPLKRKGLTVAVAEKSGTARGTFTLSGCQAKRWSYEDVEVAAKSNHLKSKGVLSRPGWNWIIPPHPQFYSPIPNYTDTTVAKKLKWVSANHLSGIEASSAPGKLAKTFLGFYWD